MMMTKLSSSRFQSKSLERGFTLIELMVVISIVFLLISLSLPAVQSAREAARRSYCQNNLHQLGLALHGYISSYNCFPVTITNKRAIPTYEGYFSPHVRLLPYLEQQTIYSSINFESGTAPLETLNWGAFQHDEWKLYAINSSAINCRISVFLCPSDGGPFDITGNNYRGNAGVGPDAWATAEHPDSGNGLFPSGADFVSVDQVPDGLSNTAAFSEKLRGSNQQPPNALPGVDANPLPDRDAFPLTVFVRTADDILLGCRIAARPWQSGFVFGGKWWFWTGRERTLYDHAQSPNGSIPDCFNVAHRTAKGMATARSLHRNGVNLLMGDGSSRFVSDSIALPVWRGMGSRNGGEIVD